MSLWAPRSGAGDPAPEQVTIHPGLPVATVVIFPVLAVPAAVVVGKVADLLMAVLPWKPGILWLLSQSDGIRGLWSWAALGLLIGVAIAQVLARETLRLTADGDGFVLSHRGPRRHVDPSTVAYAYADGNWLVLVGHEGGEVDRSDASDLNQARVVDFLRGRGVRWREDDPYADAWQEWVDGRPGLSPADHALLRDRRAALAAKDALVAERLRRLLGDRGIVVRDRDGEQQYRPTRRMGQL